MPVAVPKGAEVTLSAEWITVKGPLGTLKQALNGMVKVENVDGHLKFDVANDSREANAMSGTLRALTNNMVNGVTKGFEKKLNLVGVGYKAQAQGDKLNLSLGFSHPVVMQIRDGVNVVAEKSSLTISGIDIEAVTLFANKVRQLKKPEPYKGKGIRYSNEVVRRKQGKKSA